MTRFNGIWVPIVTPFRNDAIDFRSLRALSGRLAHAGVAGLVVCGSTGEAHALDGNEQLAVLDAVLETVSCPVVMGLSSSNARSALHRLGEIRRRPVAGLLVPPPSYVRPAQEGVRDYFHVLADASEAPLILYNIPYRTGVGITLDTYRSLAAHPRIVATKDCSGDPALTTALIGDGMLQVLAGEDAQLLPTLALGGSGAILASAHIRPDLFVCLHSHMQCGELEQARRIFYRLLPVIRLLFAEPNPGPLKAALALMGWIDDARVRAPMTAASAQLREQLMPVLQRLD